MMIHKTIYALGGLILTLASGCTTKVTTPKAHPEKYTFQVVSVEIDAKESPYQWDQPTRIEKENDLISHPETKVRNFPIVQVALGETQTIDQTKEKSLTESYEIIDGKIVLNKKIYNLGDTLTVTFEKEYTDQVQYHIHVLHTELDRFQKHQAMEGKTVKTPIIGKQELNVHPSQPPNTWATLGGLSSKKPDGTKTHLFTCIRVIAPSDKEIQ